MVNAELPAQTVRHCWALTADPYKYSYASSGNRTPLHLSGERFNKMAGVEMQPIRYQGSGPALNDVSAIRCRSCSTVSPRHPVKSKLAPLARSPSRRQNAHRPSPTFRPSQSRAFPVTRSIYLECALRSGQRRSL
ncbi:hypothetical protein J3S95_22750 [Sinorhizobium meliloti]|nr:hypothetical protein [Sinorhizobium meliloti]MCK3810845.1 hypothetical protein [Sinorhizobium meliloti]MCK3815883.1 hypothetical protein [Sinorhizobium meliloti]MDE3877531.1 hypothetical protein [Sinorhizobium meliloti]